MPSSTAYRARVDGHEDLVVGVSSKVLIECLAGGLPHLRQPRRIREHAPDFFGKVFRISRLEVQSGATIVDDFGHRPQFRDDYGRTLRECLHHNSSESLVTLR